MAAAHPDRTYWRDETEAIGNLTTTDPKQDAILSESKSIDDSDVKVVAAPFEEKTEEEKKLVRKVDMYLMPTIWILYCMSYMVRKASLSLRCS
jgi:hypothetical protein